LPEVITLLSIQLGLVFQIFEDETENKLSSADKCSTWNNSANLTLFRETLQDACRVNGISLGDDEVDKCLKYYQILCKFNRVVNLTRITDPVKAATMHFLDSIMVSKYLPEGQNILDVGSGAGFPGLVLAIIYPQRNFTLLDASQKRVDFLKIAAGQLKLENINAVHGRWPEDLADQSSDIILSRATFSDLSVWEDATRVLKGAGTLLLLRGENKNATIKGFRVELKQVSFEQLENDRFILMCKTVDENG